MRRSLRHAWLLLCVLAASPALAQVKATKGDPRSLGLLGGEWYGALELRHHVNTYYDDQGFYNRQEPSVHARAQIGAQFYNNTIDAYATFGVYKLASTQQVLQRRPELAVDWSLFKNDYVSVLQYNLAQLPYQGMQRDPDDDDTEPLRLGTVYTIGLAPQARWPIPIGSWRLDLKTGVDGWTRFYSQKQFTNDYSFEDEDEDGGSSHLGLDDNGDPVEGEPIEDYALHYQTEYMGGFAVVGLVNGLTGEATANFHTRYDPIYERTEGGTDYHYAADRYSYYRLRLAYALNDRVSIMNDFYGFHEDFFGAKRTGEERRFRNIARLTCKL